MTPQQVSGIITAAGPDTFDAALTLKCGSSLQGSIWEPTPNGLVRLDQNNDDAQNVTWIDCEAITVFKVIPL